MRDADDVAVAVVAAAGAAAVADDDHVPYDVAVDARVSLRMCLELELPSLPKLLRSPPAKYIPKNHFQTQPFSIALFKFFYSFTLGLNIGPIGGLTKFCLDNQVRSI